MVESLRSDSGSAQITSQNSSPITVRGFDPSRRPSGPPAAHSNSSGVTHSPPASRQPSNDNELRRRSSVAERLGHIGDIGGVNSLNSFARSWQRAAGFYQVSTLRPPSFQQSEHNDHFDSGEVRSRSDQAHLPRVSLLRSAFESEAGRSAPETAVVDTDDVESAAEPAELRTSLRGRGESIFDIEPHLASPFVGSPGTNYGSLSSRVNESSLRHAGKLFAQQQSGNGAPDKEREPLLVQRVEEGDKVVLVVVGQSTLPQTIFNSVNVLVGVGMLSLPLAIRYGGWLVAMIFFTVSAFVTSYTAKLLAKCLDADHSLITFADLAFVSFGSKARVIISILFTLELLASCVALVILFADSLDALISGWGTTAFKVLCGVILVPLGFLPLRLLSFTSILGVLSTFAIFLAVLLDGILKREFPGSLRQPATTYLFPLDWRTLPLSFGLLMAPWGGHSVFPNIYRDMRHPQKYNKSVNVTYTFTYILEAALAIVGYLMFGDNVRDEITSNIFLTKGYPQWISVVIAIAIAIIPLTKIPLNARPIVSTIEIFCGIDARAMPGASSLSGMSGLARGILTITIRIVTCVVIVVLAILVPSFDRVMSLLGSMACFTICIILPCAFHLKLFGKNIPTRQRVLDWVLIVISTILAVVGTVCSFLPKKALGAE